jgi:hypothetical protein
MSQIDIFQTVGFSDNVEVTGAAWHLSRSVPVDSPVRKLFGTKVQNLLI